MRPPSQTGESGGGCRRPPRGLTTAAAESFRFSEVEAQQKATPRCSFPPCSLARRLRIIADCWPPGRAAVTKLLDAAAALLLPAARCGSSCKLPSDRSMGREHKGSLPSCRGTLPPASFFVLYLLLGGANYMHAEAERLRQLITSSSPIPCIIMLPFLFPTAVF